MRVLAISGSLRPDSHNSRLLRAAQELAPSGVEWDTYDGLHTIPPFTGERDEADAPAPVLDLRERIAAADALLFVTPEYNGSIPGVLKNALDWASVPFPENALRGRPAMVIGASTGGYGGMWAQAELRKVLGIAGARVLNGDLAIAKAHEAFHDDGRLRGSSQHSRLGDLMAQLVAEVEPVAA